MRPDHENRELAIRRRVVVEVAPHGKGQIRARGVRKARLAVNRQRAAVRSHLYVVLATGGSAKAGETHAILASGRTRDRDRPAARAEAIRHVRFVWPGDRRLIGERITETRIVAPDANDGRSTLSIKCGGDR